MASSWVLMPEMQRRAPLGPSTCHRSFPVLFFSRNSWHGKQRRTKGYWMSSCLTEGRPDGRPGQYGRDGEPLDPRVCHRGFPALYLGQKGKKRKRSPGLKEDARQPRGFLHQALLGGGTQGLGGQARGSGRCKEEPRVKEGGRETERTLGWRYTHSTMLLGSATCFTSAHMQSS